MGQVAQGWLVLLQHDQVVLYPDPLLQAELSLGQLHLLVVAEGADDAVGDQLQTVHAADCMGLETAHVLLPVDFEAPAAEEVLPDSVGDGLEVDGRDVAEQVETLVGL